jgi:hypothetical protein
LQKNHPDYLLVNICFQLVRSSEKRKSERKIHVARHTTKTHREPCMVYKRIIT